MVTPAPEFRGMASGMTQTCGFLTHDGSPCENPVTHGTSKCAAGHPVATTALVGATVAAHSGAHAADASTLSAEDVLMTAPSKENWTKGRYEWEEDSIGNFTVSVGACNDNRRDGYRALLFPPKNNRVHQGWTYGIADNHGNTSSSASRRGAAVPEGVFSTFEDAKAAAEDALDRAFEGASVTENWD